MNPQFIAKRILSKIKQGEDPSAACVNELKKYGTSKSLVQSVIQVVNRVIANTMQKRSGMRPVEFPVIDPMNIIKRLNEIKNKTAEDVVTRLFRQAITKASEAKQHNIENIFKLADKVRQMKHTVRRLQNVKRNLEKSAEELVDFLTTYPELIPAVRSVSDKSRYVRDILKKAEALEGEKTIIEPGSQLDDRIQRILRLEREANELSKELSTLINEINALNKTVNSEKD